MDFRRRCARVQVHSTCTLVSRRYHCCISTATGTEHVCAPQVKLCVRKQGSPWSTFAFYIFFPPPLRMVSLKLCALEILASLHPGTAGPQHHTNRHHKEDSRSRPFPKVLLVPQVQVQLAATFFRHGAPHLPKLGIR